MAIADKRGYLAALVEELCKTWPDNRAVNVVCHGHSVPAGYLRTPQVDSFNAYPHLLHRLLKERFPFAVINVIVTAVGGETSERGERRFRDEALCHRPDLVTIDYGLNDRSIGLERAATAWSSMIEAALERQTKVILLTPTMDNQGLVEPEPAGWADLKAHAEQARRLAAHYGVGLADSFRRWEGELARGRHLHELLTQSNHPSAEGHRLVAGELVSWFPL